MNIFTFHYDQIKRMDKKATEYANAAFTFHYDQIKRLPKK